MRTPSFRSGSQPMGCCWRKGFQRTKMSKGFSPWAMASSCTLSASALRQFERGLARLGATGIHGAALLGDPVAQVGVDQGLQLGAGERVVVQQGRETVFVAVPHMPDEGALLEASHVLLKELVAQPLRQRHAFATGVFQRALPRWPLSIPRQTL
jgi:hypothetical protein